MPVTPSSARGITGFMLISTSSASERCLRLGRWAFVVSMYELSPVMWKRSGKRYGDDRKERIMASPYNINLNNIYPSGILTAGPMFAIDRISFDGVKRVYPLGHRPTTIMSAYLDGGTTLSIGWKGKGLGFAINDALIDPDSVPPTIEFASVPPRGKYADISYQYDPGAQVAVTPKVAVDDMPLVVGWEEWDYANWRDLMAAIRGNKPIEFALCKWLMQQEDNTVAFGDGQWERCYQFARSHRGRFETSEPAWGE